MNWTYLSKLALETVVRTASYVAAALVVLWVVRVQVIAWLEGK